MKRSSGHTTAYLLLLHCLPTSMSGHTTPLSTHLYVWTHHSTVYLPLCLDTQLHCLPTSMSGHTAPLSTHLYVWTHNSTVYLPLCLDTPLHCLLTLPTYLYVGSMFSQHDGYISVSFLARQEERRATLFGTAFNVGASGEEELS